MSNLRCAQRGFSLIELMVVLVIALITSLAVLQLVTGYEEQRRRTTAGSDSQQQGAIASYVMERLLKPAGAGLAQGSNVWGCPLHAAKGGVDLLPRSAIWPAPFEGMPTALRIAPLLAFTDPAGGPDRLIVMHGQAAGANVPINFSAIGAADPKEVLLVNSVAINSGRTATSPASELDIGLVFSAVGGGPGYCDLQRLASTPTLIDGSEVTPNPVRFSAAGELGRTDGVFAFSATASVLNVGANPVFSWVGIRDRTDASGSDLVTHDVLGRNGADAIVVADNVVDLRILYGVDDGSAGGVADDEVVDGWVRPDGIWAGTALSDGSSNAAKLIQQIKAVRLGLVVRSVYRERDASAGGAAQVGASSVTLFTDHTAPYVRDFAPDQEEGRYRYEAFEVTVPLRNLMFRKASN